VLSGFSFSKAYGMAGWRVGVLAHPPELGPELLKVQDTAVICPTVISQHAALGALRAGPGWVRERVRALAPQREAVRAALSPLGASAIVGGSGAIYFLARLPDAHADDKAVAEWLLQRHRVAVIPASYCGAPGHIRVCYSNLEGERMRDACSRLRAACEELSQHTTLPPAGR
jgi:aspartate/methionine/tyrosine aminotransferase